MNQLYQLNPISVPYGYIKPIENFEDFSKVIDVFKEPPFSEPLTEKDKLEEFQGYLTHGVALGYYSPDGEIMGYAGVMQEVEEIHKPYFDPNIHALNPFYIYGLATRKEYRGKYKVCTSLVEVVQQLALQHKIDFIYLRISNTGSMSEHLCLRLGFDSLHQNGIVPIQTCSFTRIDGKLGTDERRFLIKPMTQKGHNFLYETGSILYPYDSKVVYEKKAINQS